MVRARSNSDDDDNRAARRFSKSPAAARRGSRRNSSNDLDGVRNRFRRASLYNNDSADDSPRRKSSIHRRRTGRLSRADSGVIKAAERHARY